MRRPEDIKFNNIKFNKNPFPPGTERAKSWQEQQERTETMHRKATEAKWKMENFPQYQNPLSMDAALADKLTEEHFALPSSYAEGEAPGSKDLSETTGGNTTVTIHIVGPGGEDLGKTAVRQGGQADIQLSAGQVLNVAEQR